MTLSHQQQQLIANDINAILERQNIRYNNMLLKVAPEDLNEAITDYVGETRTFKAYFSSLCAAKMDSIYTYKNFPYVLDMLNNDELHFTSLEKNGPNDSSEYLETALRCMYVQPFIADDYVGPSSKVSGGNHNYFKNADGRPLPIDRERLHSYICCFTASFNKNRHWAEYARNESGVCIEISFKMPKPDKYTWLSYGRVHYDSGYDFDFLKEINLMMRTKYGKTFTPMGISKMAIMTKRDRYRWEDELRIALLSEELLNGMPFTEDPKVPGLVRVPNNNGIFHWTIKQVIAGNKISQDNLDSLRSVCQTKQIPLIE